MTHFSGLPTLLILAASLTACGNEVDPVTAKRPDTPVVLDSVTGDSILAYHPTMPDTTPPTGSNPDTTGNPGSPTPEDSLSPTGRAPILIWTPQRQGIWNRMVSENHPLFQLVKSNCQAAKNGSPRYADRGQWCTLYFQMTGDVSAARRAWAQLSIDIAMVPNANGVRENFTESVILYDWLYPALTAAERVTAVTYLEKWAENALAINTAQYEGGTRASDSDAVTGYYFGLIALDLVGEHTVPATRRWRNEVMQSPTLPRIPVGGLDATGANYNSLRNALSAFAVASAGGEWLEGDNYNMGTIVLLLMGVEAVRTATGVDHYPELTQFLIDAARTQTYHVTSDMTEAMQWGDEQNPREFVGRLYKRMTLLGNLAGVGQGTAEGAEAGALVQDLFGKYGYSGYQSAEPWARIMLTYNPYAATSSWRHEGTERFAPGRGLLMVRNNGVLFSTMMTMANNADHTVYGFGSFQLHRNGEWAVTHPLGYGAAADHGEGQNAMLIAGMSSMLDRRVLAQQSGPGWWSVTGRTAGAYYDPGYYNPPPVFLRNWTRSVVYLNRGGVDWIVTVDDVDATHPEQLTKFDRYRAADQARMVGTPLAQWIVHMPVAPTADGPDRLRWRTPGGQPVILHRLETASSVQVLDEKVLWSAVNNFQNVEKKFQVRISTNASGRMIHAISVGTDSPPAVTAITDGVKLGNTEVRVINDQVVVVN